MKPEKVEELIQNHLDMSLSSEQKSLLEDYLETHADARRDLGRYKQILGLLDTEEEVELPQDFTHRVMSNLPDISYKNPGGVFKGNIFENLTPVLGAVGMALAAVFIFAIANMETPFFKSNEISRPDGQIIDVARESIDNRDTDESQRFVGEESKRRTAQLPVKMSIHAIDGLVFLGYDPKKLKFINSGGSEDLRSGHIIRTIGNARIAYADDQTELKLKPKTELRVIDHENFHLKHGDVWVEIRKKVDHFEVKTDHLVAAVRGTTFSVNAKTIDWNTVTTTRTVLTGASSGVQVFEGLVDVRGSRGVESLQSLQQGEGVIYLEAKEGFDAYKLNPQDYKLWNEIVPEESVDEDIDVNDETGPIDSFEQEVE